ncbi:holo-ACP synthase [Salinibius halmophilus]|uniref:holo-ACP synthase n=1 Tax=Salinibius halmophilus TaxID=1853216 RepID=UPI000E674DF7|nr:holo-ACP synthase [Salinibius halmophilus]
MIQGMGVHLEELSVVQSAFDRNGESLVRRMLTPQELNIWQTHRHPVVYLATMQAIKEGLAKALHTKIGQGVSYRDISVELTEPVSVCLEGGADVRYQRHGGGQWLVSYCVSAQFVTATVLLQQ